MEDALYSVQRNRAIRAVEQDHESMEIDGNSSSAGTQSSQDALSKGLGQPTLQDGGKKQPRFE
jgi:hypothetical protein